MDIRMLLSHVRPASSGYPRSGTTSRPPDRVDDESVRVSLSSAAQLKAAAPKASKAEIEKANEMRELLSQYDFRNVTPRQMALLASKLFESYGEISLEAASSFVGIETNLVEEMDPNTPIDLVAHFDRMLKAATDANASEPGYFDYAVYYRELASKTLEDMMSFAGSNRVHISSSSASSR